MNRFAWALLSIAFAALYFVDGSRALLQDIASHAKRPNAPRYVTQPPPNLFLGTGGYPLSSGMQSPAAQSPFGAVRLGPDTGYAPHAINIWSKLFANTGTSGYFS